jgi:protein-tyrosine-phosphatase
MAEAFVNHFANARDQEVVARSAGTVGGKPINPLAVQVMAELGIGMDGHIPEILDPQMVAESDRIITMGCGVDAEACPTRFVVGEDWELEDPAGQDIEFVRQVRDDIRDRVVELLDSIR